jgi:hypothetical protein
MNGKRAGIVQPQNIVIRRIARHHPVSLSVTLAAPLSGVKMIARGDPGVFYPVGLTLVANNVQLDRPNAASGLVMLEGYAQAPGLGHAHGTEHAGYHPARRLGQGGQHSFHPLGVANVHQQ